MFLAVAAPSVWGKFGVPVLGKVCRNCSLLAKMLQIKGLEIIPKKINNSQGTQ